MAKPTVTRPKPVRQLPPPCPPETDECPNHPDLYLLETPLRTGGARSPTTGSAAETCLDEDFADVAGR